MKQRNVALRVGGGLALVLGILLASSGPSAQQKTPVKMPEPGVPQIFTMEGEYVRIAYNSEGFVTLGYRVANEFVGQEWILLEMGTTIRDGKPTYALTRSALSLSTPDGKTIPLPTNQDYLQADLRKEEMRASNVNDSINYFPPEARQACRIGFFASLESGARAFDEVELNSNRACLGRIYFKVPGGLKYGQHFLNVKFANSLVRVPFRILTADEVKTLSKTWKDLKKQVDDAFKKGK